MCSRFSVPCWYSQIRNLDLLVTIAVGYIGLISEKAQKKQSSAGKSRSKRKSDEMLLPKTNKPSARPVFFELRLGSLVIKPKICFIGNYNANTTPPLLAYVATTPLHSCITTSLTCSCFSTSSLRATAFS